MVFFSIHLLDASWILIWVCTVISGLSNQYLWYIRYSTAFILDAIWHLSTIFIIIIIIIIIIVVVIVVVYVVLLLIIS